MLLLLAFFLGLVFLFRRLVWLGRRCGRLWRWGWRFGYRFCNWRRFRRWRWLRWRWWRCFRLLSFPLIFSCRLRRIRFLLKLIRLIGGCRCCGRVSRSWRSRRRSGGRRRTCRCCRRRCWCWCSGACLLMHQHRIYFGMHDLCRRQGDRWPARNVSRYRFG